MTQDTTAQIAEARHSYAQSPCEMGEISQQSGFQPVLRRKLMAALSMTGRELGLRPATLMVLDTLLSFLPCTNAAGKEMPVTPQHLLTIYASNDTISFRARGLTDRQLRRHFDVLEQKGLIKRRDSANCKRFPIYQNGKVVGAYGIDLMPLFAQAQALLERAAVLREEQQEIRGIKAQISQMRNLILEKVVTLPQTAIQFLDQLRNVTRRVGLTLIEAKALLKQVSGLTCPPEQASEAMVEEPQAVHKPKEMPACAGQNVRHNKPKNTYTKKSIPTADEPKPHDTEQTWLRLRALSEYFPSCPQTSTDLKSILHLTGEMLRIDKALYLKALNNLKPLHLAEVLDRILRHHDRIQSPNVYLQKVLRSELSCV